MRLLSLKMGGKDSVEGLVTMSEAQTICRGQEMAAGVGLGEQKGL